jgi:hypothetical protein
MSTLKDKLDQVDKKLFDIKKKQKEPENTAETEIVLSSFDKSSFKIPEF